ncbi:MAG: signal recognition particle-docking protein FtsY [Symbiobacterium thermophilum]|uniref:Signal recognition particle receptor FtsY n=1 Tax=Symbiobacterium thermophilum TaxID=2734 RepID=A0A953LGF6_SYMTR|nr:signal recognition particle-docking protein FtsY [Symbiobacterium thermophilum]
MPANGGRGVGEGESPVSFFERLKAGLQKTKEALIGQVNTVMSVFRKIDDDLFDELEEALIRGDVGVATSAKLVEELRREARQKGLKNGDELLPLLKELVAERLGSGVAPLGLNEGGLTVILVVGVNGVGKTTTIGKLARHLREDRGLKVVLAAADTFRAAAMDQLKVWGERAGAEVVTGPEGADPAAVAFDGVKAARASGADVLIVDTAGRLHNKAHLMAELGKIARVLGREVPGAPHETLLVLDATTGQNAIQQTRLFKETVPVTGIALTKLDGTAKGGVVVAIADTEQVPVKFIGVGERLDDLQPFDPRQFVEALFSE